MSKSENQLAIEQARETILANSRSGTLATMSDKHPEFPFTSVAPFSLTSDQQPIFLFSSMAVHSRNLKRNNRATLLVTGVEGDSLAGGRVSLLGTIEPLSADLRSAAATAYLKDHPEAQQWISFGDFSFCRMQVIDSYVVAGFGSMGWIQPENG